MNYSYPIWLLIFAVLPLIVIFLLTYKIIKKYLYIYPLTAIGSLIFSIPWDIISVRERIWEFPASSIFGIWLFNLPIEEYIFIVLITWVFASLTILFWEKNVR